MIWMRDALRRSGGGRDGDLDGRNRECCPCFRLFARICKRLLMLEVQMLILFWGFQLDLLGMVLFLMAIQGTPHKEVSWF